MTDSETNSSEAVRLVVSEHSETSSLRGSEIVVRGSEIVVRGSETSSLRGSEIVVRDNDIVV